MVVTDGETGRGYDKQTVFTYVQVVYGKSVTSAQMLEVSIMRERKGAPSRKGRAVNGQITQANNK